MSIWPDRSGVPLSGLDRGRVAPQGGLAGIGRIEGLAGRLGCL